MLMLEKIKEVVQKFSGSVKQMIQSRFCMWRITLVFMIEIKICAFSYCVGVPKWRVRVTSVVPSLKEQTTKKQEHYMVNFSHNLL